MPVVDDLVYQEGPGKTPHTIQTVEIAIGQIPPLVDESLSC